MIPEITTHHVEEGRVAVEGGRVAAGEEEAVVEEVAEGEAVIDIPSHTYHNLIALQHSHH